MFPTPRLLLAAILASVVAWTFGFAVFAAFRVNHEPLSRLPVVTAPLQLVADETASGSPASSADEGLPYRPPRPSEAQTGGMEASAPAVTPVRLGAVDPSHPGPTWAAKIKTTGKPVPALREHQGAALGSAAAVASPAVLPSVAVTPPPAPAARPSVAVAPPPGPPAPTKPPAPVAVSVAAPPASTLVPATAAGISAPPATRPATGVMVDAGAKNGGAAKQAGKPVVAAIAPPAVVHPAAIAGTIIPIVRPSQAISPAKLGHKSGSRTARVAFERRPIRRVPAYAGTHYGPDSSDQEPVFRSAPGYASQSQDSGGYANSFRFSDGY
jgi:hypothetical protein